MHRARAGFTLIELLIVVVIMAVLASIAIPHFLDTKRKGYIASAKADLRNITTAEEAYYAAYSIYTTNLGYLGVRSSNGVTITFVAADSGGFGASATHPAFNPVVCAIFFGSSSTHGVVPATDEGQIACN
jgi:prepilin-type N-terminal cleavage/methylation domain-containing protein